MRPKTISTRYKRIPALEGGMQDTFDALIIGSGTAGQTTAYKLNEAGLRVGLIEQSDKPGGTCALRGCQAKKWFYEAAAVVAHARHLQDIGIVSPPTASWSQLCKAKNAFTAKVPDNTVKGLKKAGIAYIQGSARFQSPHSLVAGERKYTADHIVLATGAVPSPLPIKGIEHVLTSSAFLELDALPQRIVFIGGGFISFEFAHFAARLGDTGIQCTILEAGPRPLGPFDAEMVELLVGASLAEGMDIECDVVITAIEKTESGFRVITENHGNLDADMVVHGAGRAPDIQKLHLDAANVDASRHGIVVDQHMATSVPHIFAVGDCAATVQLARVADAEAATAANNIIARHKGDNMVAAIDYDAVPAVLFTYPQYAMVGKTEQTLLDEGVTFNKNFAKELSWPTYTRVGLRSAAFKIFADSNGYILGAHILSDNATGLINTFAMAMKNKIAAQELYEQSIMTPYPSRESDIIYMLRPMAK